MTAIEEVRTREKPAKTAQKAAGRNQLQQRKPRRTAKPPHRPRGSLIAALDIGTTKMCCFIGRIDPERPQVIGIGHQVSRGVRNGTIVDLEAAGNSIRGAVHAAEEMAGETIQHVVVNLSGGFIASRIIKAEIGVAGREIGDGRDAASAATKAICCANRATARSSIRCRSASRSTTAAAFATRAACSASGSAST